MPATSANKDSARSRRKLLQRVAEDPRKLTKQIGEACKSQGALANLELPNEGIDSMALNTLKEAAKAGIEAVGGKNGWTQLDELRVVVKQIAAQRSGSKQASRRQTTDQRIKELEELLSKSEIHRLRVNAAFRELLNVVQPLAVKDAALQAKVLRIMESFSIHKLAVIEGGADGED